MNDAASWGRIAASSNVFRDCMYSVTTQQQPFTFPNNGGTVDLYFNCAGDAVPDFSNHTAYDVAMANARGWNWVQISCDGTTGNASTGQNDGVWHPFDEKLAFSSWLTSNSGNPDWGLRQQAAGIIWHEAFHTHDWGHGHNTTNSLAYQACGITARPACADGTAGNQSCWHFQNNTMPYIVQQCIQQTLYTSRQTCSGLTCPAGTLPIITSKTSTSSSACECVQDPQLFGQPDVFLWDGATLLDNPYLFVRGRISHEGILEHGSGWTSYGGFYNYLITTPEDMKRTWTNAAALPYGLRLFINKDTGAARTINAQTAAVVSSLGFAPGYTHYATMPNGQTFVYNKVTGNYATVTTTPAGAMSAIAAGTLPTSYRIVTAAGFDQVLLIDPNGGGQVGKVVNGIYTTQQTFGFAQWDRVVYLGDHSVLFYQKSTGIYNVGRFAPNNGAWTFVHSGFAGTGFEKIATTFDGRVLWFDVGAHYMYVSTVRPDGTLYDWWGGSMLDAPSARGFDLLVSNGSVGPDEF